MDPEDGSEQVASTRALARELLDGGGVDEISSKVRGLWEFDDVVYRGAMPSDLDEFVAMCWWQASDAFEQSGGRDRLLIAAKRAAAQP